jgi:hypothetical protein
MCIVDIVGSALISSDLRDQGRAHTGAKQMVRDDVLFLSPELAMCSVGFGLGRFTMLGWAGLKLLRLIRVGQTASRRLAFRLPECAFLREI